jgi:hypothetical protein
LIDLASPQGCLFLTCPHKLPTERKKSGPNGAQFLQSHIKREKRVKNSNTEVKED